MENAPPSPVDTWMGHSAGHWEGETLVVHVSSFNDQTWFDRAGNFLSDELHVVERYTPLSHDALHYEATVEDRRIFSRPWKMSMPLYRRLEKNTIDDPTAFTRAWKGEVPLTKDRGRYMSTRFTREITPWVNMLKGARAQEKEAAK